MSQSPPARATRNVLIGVLVCGVLLIGIFATISLRQTLNRPTPTPTLEPLPTGVTSMTPPKALPDFTLPASTGQSMSLSSFYGKYTLMFFGYTHCPDYCPLTLTHWKSIRAKLGDDAENVNFLFISVDGERDTPQVLQRYLSRFDPSFVGMSGDDATLGKIGPDYGLYYELHKEEGANYSVDHTTQSYLLNLKGQMVDVFDFDTAENDIVATIRKEMVASVSANT